MIWPLPFSPFLAALPKACSSILKFVGIKVRITCNPPLFSVIGLIFISVPLHANYVEIITVLGSICLFKNSFFFEPHFLYINLNF